MSHQAENCKRYQSESRKEKNFQRKANRYAKFLKWCKSKWQEQTLIKQRTPKGTARKLRRVNKQR